MSDSSNAANATQEVSLAVYDLSNGMARSLSAQFLGPAHAIDIIPHTALLAYGREYYFGGGIQSCKPHEFRRQRGIHPIEVTPLGRTTVSQREFEDWCAARTADGSFAPEAYDLMTRNCNNFSHEAATGGLRLGQGVPEWILGVPNRFLSSPMGQMIRPILDGMQMSGPEATSGGQTFGRAAIPTSAPPAAAVSAANNPWANVSSPPPTAPTSVTAEIAEAKTPTLDSYNRPLLSADTGTVKICVSKLSNNMTEAERSSVEDLGTVLATPDKALAHQVLESSLPVLLRCLDPTSTTNNAAAFALMLLRLVALRPPADAGAALELKECAVLVGANMIQCHDTNSSSSTAAGEKQGDNKRRPLSVSHAARSMAWCYFGNAVAADATCAFLLRDDPALREGLIDAALSDMSTGDGQQRREVRQSAAAFAYNVAHGSAASGGEGEGRDGEEVPDLYVTLLCGALEGLAEEGDATVKLRRLLIAGKILRSGRDRAVNGAVKSLATDLGFVDAICSLQEQGVDVGGNEDENSVMKVANELNQLLKPTLLKP